MGTVQRAMASGPSEQAGIDAQVARLKAGAKRSVLAAAENGLRLALDRGQRDESSVNPVVLYTACRVYSELYEEVNARGENE